MSPQLVYREDGREVWHGDSTNAEDVAEIMGNRIADSLVVDAPYSPKTHSGHREGRLTADRAAAFAETGPENRKAQRKYNARKAKLGTSGRRDIGYGPWSNRDVEACVDLWARHLNGWFVSLTDAVLAPHWLSSYERNDRVVFAPLPFVESGSRVRMAGDGPACWSCWVLVSRPKGEPFSKWGSLPGAYVVPADRSMNSRGGQRRIVGGKSEQGMLQIVGDYSRPGDLVVDPTCGWGTTLTACKKLGRRSIGIDKSLENAEMASKMLQETAYVPPLFTEAPTMEQVAMFGGGK